MDPTYVNLFQIDTTLPVVTVAYPKSGATDSTYVSAKTEQSLSYYSDSDGTRAPRCQIESVKTVDVGRSARLLTRSWSRTAMISQRRLEPRMTTFRMTLRTSSMLELPDWKDDDGDDAGTGKLVVTAWDVVGNKCGR